MERVTIEEVNRPVFTLLDIDKFKNLNTNLGYEEADKKLKQLADLFLKLEARVQDNEHIHKLHSCRIQGDEFVLVWELNSVDNKSSAAAYEEIK